MPHGGGSNNPYRSPSADCEPNSLPHAAELVQSGWLYRKVQLSTPANTTIEYNGRGFGYETVLVDGVVAVRKWSGLWFVPHFDFLLPTKSGDLAASLDVGVFPWLALSHLVIIVEGVEVYAEG